MTDRAADLAEGLQRYFQQQAPERVVAAYLYGSHAAGRAVRDSDVDVALLLEADTSPGEAFDVRVRVSSDLVGELHADDVDVLVLNEAPPLLAERVLREGKLVYCRDRSKLHAFAVDRLLRAADLRPFLERHEKTLLRSLAR